MFQYQYAAFNYEPYPIGLVKPILDESFYQELVASFPDIGLFRLNKSYGGKTALKYSLSEGNNPELYQKFITNTSVWREFHQWIKSSDFIKSTLEMLLEHHIDLGLLKPEKQQQVGWLKKLLSKKQKDNGLSSRFEFSALPSNGGCFHPHTDAPGKIVTLILSIVGEDGWDQALGGGTEVMRPLDMSRSYNWMNHYLDFDDVETLTTYEYQPNQAVVFIKTYNSLHAVRPLKGSDASHLRRTVTINIKH